MRPLKERISITIDSDLLEKLRESRTRIAARCHSTLTLF